MYINLDVLNITNGNTHIIDSVFGRMNIEKIEAGKLKLLTGRIITTDPVLLYDDECFRSMLSRDYILSIYMLENAEKEKNKLLPPS